MNELKLKLVNIIYECNQHRDMIDHVYQKIASYLPLSEDDYSHFDKDMIGYIDQFLFRFSKLQDSMGEKLFSTMLLLVGEDMSKKPFIDMLNRLEKMELLYTNDWLQLRKIRNDVTHEYSSNVSEVVGSLNAIFCAQKDLLAIYHVFYEYCINRFQFVEKN